MNRLIQLFLITAVLCGSALAIDLDWLKPNYLEPAFSIRERRLNETEWEISSKVLWTNVDTKFLFEREFYEGEPHFYTGYVINGRRTLWRFIEGELIFKRFEATGIDRQIGVIGRTWSMDAENLIEIGDLGLGLGITTEKYADLNGIFYLKIPLYWGRIIYSSNFNTVKLWDIEFEYPKKNKKSEKKHQPFIRINYESDEVKDVIRRTWKVKFGVTIKL